MTTTSIISVATATGSEIQTKVANAASGTLLQSAGTSSAFGWTTATYPATAGTSGNVLTSNGTNFVSSANNGGLTIVTTTLTNAQIKALKSTPITLVAAPTAGKILVPLQMVMKFNYGGNNAFVTGGNITVIYSTSAIVLMQTNSAFYTGTVDKIYTLMICQANGATTGTAEAQALQITTATIDPTGNAANDNTISVWLSYQTLTIT